MASMWCHMGNQFNGWNTDSSNLFRFLHTPAMQAQQAQGTGLSSGISMSPLLSLHASDTACT